MSRALLPRLWGQGYPDHSTVTFVVMVFSRAVGRVCGCWWEQDGQRMKGRDAGSLVKGGWKLPLF